MKEVDDFKSKKGQKIEKYFWEEKEELLKMEKKGLKNHTRLHILHQILMPWPKILNKNQKKNDFEHQNKTLLKSNTKNIILSGAWMK